MLPFDRARMMNDVLDYQEIRYRLESYGVFRILRKESAAFMLGFFYDQFKRRHRADIGQAELCAALGAYQEFVRMSEGEEAQRRESAAYLDEWSNEGFLRKYYPLDSSEACYDLTPDSERALEWIGELTGRPFVGAESRLLALFETLRDLVYGASFDPAEQRAELERRRSEIDEEIARLDRGESTGLDDTRILERYYGAEDSARRLLADFKQIEQNFRDLDRATKERVIASDRSRARFLRKSSRSATLSWRATRARASPPSGLFSCPSTSGTSSPLSSSACSPSRRYAARARPSPSRA